VVKKPSGYTFFGEGSMRPLRECSDDGLVKAEPEARFIPRSYYGIWAAIHRARAKAGLDPEMSANVSDCSSESSLAPIKEVTMKKPPATTAIGENPICIQFVIVTITKLRDNNLML